MNLLTRKTEQWRLARKEACFRLFNANLLFIGGLLLTVIFLYTQALSLKVCEALFFAFLAWAAGQKLRPFAMILTIFFVLFFNLFSPAGEELWHLGALLITKEALLDGIGKAVTLEGLILLSRTTVRGDLRLPGHFGSLLSETFRQLEKLLAMKKQFNPHKPIESLDGILLALASGTELEKHNQESIPGTELE